MTEENNNPETENNDADNEGTDNDALDQAAIDAAEKEKAEEKGADGKEEGEDAPSSDGAPEEYDTSAFEMPEGVEFDKEGFEEIEPILRDMGLTQDNASKLMSGYADKILPLAAKRTEAAFKEAGDKLSADMAAELNNDPQVGGGKLEESKALAAKARDHFLSSEEDNKEFSDFLSATGFGNNRYLMRIMAGAGRLLSEASTPPAASGSGSKTMAEKFYG